MDERDRIEKLMQMENMNSTQFALETGIQTSTLSHILNGRNKVSLEVLKKILSRFKNISSDWLILGIGAMNRQEFNSQIPTLFDFVEENSYESDNYIIKNPEKSINELSSEKNTDNIANTITRTITLPPRKIKRIIVYFDDNSFQEFSGDN